MAENQGGPVQAAPKMKSETGKKSGKRAVAVIIPVMLIALVIAFAVLTVTRNLFGGRDGIIRFLCSMDPAYETMDVREAGIDALEKDLSSRETRLQNREAALKEAEAALEAEAEALEQERIDRSFELYIAALSEERIEQFQQLGEIFSNMEAQKAADALSEVGSETDMAVVIYYMEPESAAEVLGNMETALTAKITESLLN